MSYQRKYDFKNGTVMDAEQVDAEFNQLIAAVNSLESADELIKSKAQMSKITADTGAPKLSITDVTKNFLQELASLGVGSHTFYAASGVIGLPPTNLSIRGIAHFTSANYGWVYATDYKNNIFTNYCDAGVWKGWKQLISFSYDTWADALNTMMTSGFYYVNPNTSNAPTTNAGNLTVINLDKTNMFLSQTFIDLTTGLQYTRIRTSGVWQPWINQ